MSGGDLQASESTGRGSRGAREREAPRALLLKDMRNMGEIGQMRRVSRLKRDACHRFSRVTTQLLLTRGLNKLEGDWSGSLTQCRVRWTGRDSGMVEP